MKKELLIWVGIVAVFVALIIGLVAIDKAISGKDRTVLSTDADWSIGPKDAKVTLLEYSDFQCPACAYYHGLLKTVLDKYGSKIRFSYRHFPLPQHPNAVFASEFVEASGKQGKFWEMYNMVFEKQKGWSDLPEDKAKAQFILYAKSFGLDEAKLLVDASSTEVKAKIEADTQDGLKAGLRGTPTFFLNGELIENPQGDIDFESLISKAINDSAKSDSTNTSTK
ncbi:MAG: thioredoxin domain-containing protein [bacterium]